MLAVRVPGEDMGFSCDGNQHWGVFFSEASFVITLLDHYGIHELGYGIRGYSTLQYEIQQMPQLTLTKHCTVQHVRSTHWELEAHPFLFSPMIASHFTR